MITTTFSNTRPASMGLMAVKQETTMVKPLEESFIDYCRCLCACPVVLRVFAHDSGNEFKNDKTAFLQRKTIATDTVVFKLYKDGVFLDNLDSTYGDFYDFGDLADPYLNGCLLHWDEVYDLHGYGVYQIITSLTSIGTAIDIESDYFELCESTDDRADGTVRIETYQNGYILSGTDYTGLNWYQQHRLPGWFGDKKPTFETDNYLKGDREISQIQDSIRNVYTLETELLPESLLNWITYDGLLSNRILITDYNLCTFERYQKLEVYPESIDDFSTFRRTPNGLGRFKFTDKKQNILKRNFI